MENLTQSETEEIIASLIFSNYIKSNGKFNKNSLELLNKILHDAYKKGYTNIVRLVDNQYMLTDSSFEKVIQLVGFVSGEKFENISVETKRILNDVRGHNFN